MSKLSEHPYISIGSLPVSEAQPCGENVRYESDFEQLEAELGKQESLSSETVDWDVVSNLSAKIIKESSKDLLVGSYLCYSLLLKEDFKGLAVGLTVLNDMVSNHWDCLFPPAKRLRARATAITWLAEKAAVLVAEKSPGPADAEAVVAASNALRELDNNLVEKMGDQAPLLTELSRPLKNYKQSAEAELAKSQAAAEPPPVVAEAPAQEAAPVVETVEETKEAPVAVEPESTPATPAPAPTISKEKAKASAPPAVETGNLESDADTKKVLRQLQTGVRDVAAFGLSQKLSDPKAYRLARISAWMVVENAPPNNGGVTQINPPAAERLKFFESLIEKADNVALVTELEKTLARSSFWLEGHYLVVKTLRALGAEYENAAKTVIRELNNHLSRLPELVGLSFSDGTPFASDQAQLWIESEVMVSSAGESESGGSSGSAEPWDSVLAEAKKASVSGDTDAAMAMINEGLASAGSGRSQAYWRCALAELLIQIGNAPAASSILEQVSQQIDESGLVNWEPQLPARIFKLLFQSYQKQQKGKKDDPELAQKVEQSFSQLCWFDPVTALSVKGG